MEKSKNLFPYFAGIIMSSIFGLTFIFTKRALETLTPMVLLAYRFSIAATIMTILFVLKKIKLDYKNKPIKGVLSLSIFYPAISFIFETIAMQYTSTSQAGIMVSLSPIYAMILSIVFLKEMPTLKQRLFVFSSVVGVIITVIFSKNEGFGNSIGVIFLIISVFSGSVHNILSRKYSEYFTSVEITFSMVWVGAIFFSIISIIQGMLNHNINETFILSMKSMSTIVSVLYLSILASVIAFFAMNYMLSKLPAVNASVFTNLSTIIAIIAGVIIEKENLYWYQILGGFFIILGVWGTNYYGIKGVKNNLG
jgi:drug/metabolite transporter (DMT)-like permease